MTDERPPEDRRFVHLATLQDPVVAEMVRDLLADHGIPTATPGLMHRSLFGVAGGFVAIRLEVPRPDLPRARELLEAFFGAPT